MMKKICNAVMAGLAAVGFVVDAIDNDGANTGIESIRVAPSVAKATVIATLTGSGILLVGDLFTVHFSGA